MKAHYVGVQQLRFWAALAVVVHHTLRECSVRSEMTLAPMWVFVGACGVDVFFVISGFVIWQATQGLQADIGAGTFFRRRLFRILPLYWLCLIVVLLLWSSGLVYRSLPVSKDSVVAGFLLLPVDREGMIWSVAWTLVYEMYFYAMCGLALLCAKGAWRLACLALLLLGIPGLLGWVGADTPSAVYRNPMVLEFVFGGLLASQVHRFQELRTRALPFRAGIAAVACAGLSASTFFLYSEATDSLPNELRWWAWGLPALLLVGASLVGDQHASGSWGKLLAWLGNASYAIYLTHNMVLVSLARLLKAGWFVSPWALATAGVVAVLLAVAFGAWVHRWVELPMAHWLSRRFAEVRLRASPAPLL